MRGRMVSLAQQTSKRAKLGATPVQFRDASTTICQGSVMVTQEGESEYDAQRPREDSVQVQILPLATQKRGEYVPEINFRHNLFFICHGVSVWWDFINLVTALRR
jgi:hypothetical protein